MDDAARRPDPRVDRGDGGALGLVWRRTWPVGAADDFVADLAGGGWARVRLVRDAIGRGRWQWSVAGRRRGGGAADTRIAAETALRRMV